MDYIVIEEFKDHTTGRTMRKGEKYPPYGHRVPDERIQQLLTEDNKCARAFIEPAEEGPQKKSEEKKAAK